MIRSRNGVIRPAAERADNEERQPLPRAEAPPVTPPVYYNPIIQQQAEIDSLREQNHEQQRLLELQSREQQTRTDDLHTYEVRLANENQELRRLLELQAREHQQFKDEINITVATLRQQYQTEIDDLRSMQTWRLSRRRNRVCRAHGRASLRSFEDRKAIVGS